MVPRAQDNRRECKVSFPGLPRELRDKVYDYLVADLDTVPLPCNSSTPGPVLVVPDWPTPSPRYTRPSTATAATATAAATASLEPETTEPHTTASHSAQRPAAASAATKAGSEPGLRQRRLQTQRSSSESSSTASSSRHRVDGKEGLRLDTVADILNHVYSNAGKLRQMRKPGLSLSDIGLWMGALTGPSLLVSAVSSISGLRLLSNAKKSLPQPQKPQLRNGAELLLTSRKAHDEYAEALCRRKRLTFTISNKDTVRPDFVVHPFSLRPLTVSEVVVATRKQRTREQQLLVSPITHYQPLATHVKAIDVIIELHPTESGKSTFTPGVYNHMSIYAPFDELLGQFLSLERLRIEIPIFGDFVRNPVCAWSALAAHVVGMKRQIEVEIAFRTDSWPLSLSILRQAGGKGRERTAQRPTWEWVCSKGHSIKEYNPGQDDNMELYFFTSLYESCTECLPPE